jgi:dUTP pyrophosphatase
MHRPLKELRLRSSLFLNSRIIKDKNIMSCALLDKKKSVGVFCVSPESKLKKATRGSAYDLRASEEVVINPREVVKIKTGVFLSMGDNYYAQVSLRSSIGSLGLCMPHGVGVIDSDYHGEVIILLINLMDHPISIGRFERVANLIFCKKDSIELVEIESLDTYLNIVSSDNGRGSGGFGSTGKA